MKELADAFNNLVGFLNILGGGVSRAEVIRSNFSRLHRTLQQQFVTVVVLPVLRQLAQDYAEGRYDGRNEASAALSAKMLAAVTEDDLYLPFI